MRRVKPHNVGQQFHQLPMFLSAREIRSTYRALDADRHDVIDDWEADHETTRPETDDELFDRKYDDAIDKDEIGAETGPNSRSSLRDHLLEHGVHNPVSLELPGQSLSGLKPQILGGHHRVAVMSKHKPDALIPVEHHTDRNAAERHLGERY